jgi:hypothetical protein
VAVVSHPALSVTSTGVAIAVWVVPGSSRTVIQDLHGDRLKIRVAAPAEGGRANQEVAELLSAVVGAKVSLKTGIRGRAKVFEVTGADLDGVRRKLGI